jgi:hypothetical protein
MLAPLSMLRLCPLASFLLDSFWTHRPMPLLHTKHITNSKYHLLHVSNESGCRVVTPASCHTRGSKHDCRLPHTCSRRARGQRRGRDDHDDGLPHGPRRVPPAPPRARRSRAPWRRRRRRRCRRGGRPAAGPGPAPARRSSSARSRAGWTALQFAARTESPLLRAPAARARRPPRTGARPRSPRSGARR